ncbi:hypothetical protein ACFLT8_00600 [Chloroflexota bacterium]
MKKRASLTHLITNLTAIVKVNLSIRPRNIYPLFIKGFLNSFPQLTHYIPLLNSLNIAENLNLYSRVGQIIYHENLRECDNSLVPFFISSLSHQFYYAYGLVKIYTVTYRNIKVYPGEVSVEITSVQISPLGI